MIARLNRGGTSKFVEAVVIQLEKLGFEVKVATGHVQGSELEDEAVGNLPVQRIKTLGRKVAIISDLKARRELREIIKQFKPRIIYSHTFKAGLLARTLRTEGTKYVHCFHGHLLNDPEFKKYKRLIVYIERLLAKRTDFLVATGNSVAKDLIREGIGTEKQFSVIAPGVPTSSLIDKDLARRTIGLHSDETRPVVVWVARMEKVKSPSRVIGIANAIPEAIFLMAGGGSQLESMTQMSKPENLIILGWQDSSLMNSIADIAISTSLNEGMPISLIESQLAGLPVVAMDVGAISDVVIDQKTGFICKDINSQFISNLRSLVLDSALRELMGRNARAHAAEKFTIASLISNHLALFERFISE